MRNIKTELSKKNPSDYGLISANELEFDFDDIKLHQFYPYTKLCKLIGVSERDSVNKRLVLNELKRYCIFEEKGNEIKIYSIFKKPRTSTPIKLGEYKKQFNLSQEDAFKSGIFAVVKDKCLVVDYCRKSKCFLDQFLTYLTKSQRFITPGSAKDLLIKGGVFIPLEIEGEDYNKEFNSSVQRVKYVADRISAKGEYVVFNNTPRAITFARGKKIEVPVNNYHKAMKLLSDNNLI